MEALLITGRQRARFNNNWPTRDRAALVIVQVVALEPEIVPGVVEREIAPAVEPAPAIALVAAERETAPAVAELEHDPVVAELGHDLAAAVLARGHPHARPAVAPTTKSVTAARRRGPVPLLAAEDLAAAVAETTREPVATEAAIAWEVADTVAVEEAVVVAVAADGDEHSMRKNQ